MIRKCSFWSLQGLKSFMPSPLSWHNRGCTGQEKCTSIFPSFPGRKTLASGQVGPLGHMIRLAKLERFFTDTMTFPSMPEPWNPKPSKKPPTPLSCIRNQSISMNLLKSLLCVWFMIWVPFLFRVLVHNSAVYVIYDTRNNLNHIRNYHIIGTLESYIFLVMVKLLQW